MFLYACRFEILCGGSEHYDFLVIRADSKESADALCEKIVVADNEHGANIISGADGEIAYCGCRQLRDGDWGVLLRLGLAHAYFDEGSVREMIEAGNE